MRFDENPVQAEIFVRRANQADQEAHPRAPGLHATDLIYCPRKAWYRLNQGIEHEPTLREITLWLTGHGHHQILQANKSHGAADLQDKLSIPCPGMCPSSVVHEAVANLDFLEVDGEVILPVEIKSTRKSSAAVDSELASYIEQITLYMCRWGRVNYTTLTVQGRLYILFLMGDYKANRTPILKCWDLEVDISEMKAWADELGLRAHTILMSPTPPVPERWGWECSYCPYAGSPCEQAELAKGRGGDKTGIKQSMFLNIDTLPDWLQPEPPEVPNDGDPA